MIALAMMLSWAVAHPQEYPTRPIRIIVPTGPGGAPDLITRLLAQDISIALGKAIVVDNRSGGGGVVGGPEIPSRTGRWLYVFHARFKSVGGTARATLATAI